MSLIKTSISYATDQKFFKIMMILSIFNEIVLTTLESELMIRISDGSIKLLIFFLLSQILSPIIDNFIITPISSQLNTTILKKFNSDNIKRYNRLSYDSKVTKPYSIFEKALSSAQNSLSMMITWGLPNLINLISKIIGVIWTFYQKKLLLYFFIVVLVCGIIYRCFIKELQESYTKLHKKLRKEIQLIHAKIQLEGIPFQYKECSLEHMINMNNDVIEKNALVNEEWEKINTYTSMTINLVSTSIIYIVSNNVSDFLLISIVLRNLSCAIQNSSSFMTQFNRMNNDFENFTDFWKNTTEENEPEKLDINNKLIKVEHVKIERSNYIIKLDKPFNIWKGQKILIEGPTGHGKSSFIKALFGMVPTSNIELSYGQGKNFYHQVADYFQEIKEKMHTSNISISDIFRGEKDIDKIKKYLLLAWSTEEHDRIINSIIKSNESQIENKIHPYFMPINEKLSGGQKSRLLLWNRGYIVDNMKKEIIILDEPCPDVDFDTYIETIKKFFNMYDDKLIIMIGHLCDCKRKEINADKIFDLELLVENGLIKTKRTK